MRKKTFQDTISRLKSIREKCVERLSARGTDFMCPSDIQALDSVIGTLEALERRSLWQRFYWQLRHAVL